MNSFWDPIYKDLLIDGVLVAAVGGAINTYLNESLVVLRTSFLVASATRKLESRNPKRIARGAHTLLEIARTQPTRRQEMVDLLAEKLFRRTTNNLDNIPQPLLKDILDALAVVLRGLLSLPRKDDNDHELNIDLHQIRFVSPKNWIYLEKLNLNGVVLWGSEFQHVDLSRSTLENADLGGAQLLDCGLEDVNMKNARFSFSPMEPRRPTIMEDCSLARSCVEEGCILDASCTQLVLRRPRDLAARSYQALLQMRPSVAIEQASKAASSV